MDVPMRKCGNCGANLAPKQRKCDYCGGYPVREFGSGKEIPAFDPTNLAGHALYVAIKNHIVKHFGFDEIHELCMDLDIDIENLGGSGSGKLRIVLRLVEHCERRSMAKQLLAVVS